ncbi:biotin--[acetyl-CoA-carboxylase] ligase [Microbacterium dauci]|uniref:Biotin--[acetyl-CoA-carboxylase] ligase n=1 Tax=Microbacterium dauci TaxID=3048008 RepID=A0ABT6Z9U4_9MICO|nr:biotin--[acetyl-CoA-carboxylase] ligase [Microbacterium sp. LX3-4]MDJ1112924.1 biotin--[acetyl-CoA-carboxylase] ligase [Microbacterium sp. LX3-4]
MSLPSDGYPLAAVVSPRLHVIESVGSTNAKLLRDAADDPAGHPHLATVLTRDQTAGRGRLDRTWTAPAGSALAVSVLLRVGAVPIEARGWIPLAAGAAMAAAVRAQLSDTDVTLKWPNDILVAGLKISGILAEVLPSDPQAVVVGAGVNTAMTAADLPVPTATSFAARGVVADEDRLLADYLTGLRDAVADIAVGGDAFDRLRERIGAECSTVGADVRVSLPDGTDLDGRVARLDEDGRLVIETLLGEQTVAAGDVVHVR